jgi:eukaryotic-like serine/threonine-protein kinase
VYHRGVQAQRQSIISPMLTSGTKIGPYEIVAPIGAGGMGEVYRARDTRLGREVAIKVLPASFASDPERLRRFEQEARATGMLNHPNILAVFDVGTHQGSPYLVTELLEGQTLREELPTPRRKALDYARQIAAGLAAAHAKGVTHRDLKPDNLYITNDGRVKILDFGLAKVAAVESDSDATVTGGTTPGIAMGTVGYMSPEQARGQVADHRSDIFSFGVVLYEMLSGQRAFHRDSTMDTLSAILKEDPPALADAALEPVVRRCLEKSPDQRFQSASDLGFAIQALTGSVMTQALPATAETAAKPAAGPARRTALLLGALLAVVGIAVGVAGGIWWQNRRNVAPVWEGIQLTGSGIVYGPRISPDGSTLAFITVEGGQGQVAVMHPGSASWTVLTHDDKHGEANYICWSKDGAKLYFSRRDGIYSVPALGGEQRRVMEQTEEAEALPDGNFLVTRLNADRKLQLFRFSPESGKSDSFDAQVVGQVRVLRDGRRAVFFGSQLSDPKASIDLQVIDLATGKLRGFAPHLSFAGVGLAIPPGGNSVLALGGGGDLWRVMEVPLDAGRGPKFRTVVTLSSPVWFLDAAPDGTIYTDQVSRPFDILRFPTSGGTPERVVESSVGAYAPLALPDHRVLFASSLAGRGTLMVASPGKNPAPLVQTEEETTGPFGMLGDHQVAFRIGHQGDNNNWMVATATANLNSPDDGRIVRRLESTRRRRIGALVGSHDGKTLFYVSDGVLWSMPAEGGEERKIGPADAVAPSPNGEDVVVLRYGQDRHQLFRLPLAPGGKEQMLPFESPLLLNPTLSPAAVRADGRISITVVRADSWWDEPAILDPKTGKVEKLTVPYDGDAFFVGWAPDGAMVAAGQPIHGALWRFRPMANP